MPTRPHESEDSLNTSKPRRVYDVSLTIHPGMLSWPGDPGIEVDPDRSMELGDTSNVSLLRLGSHTATHIDAPRHFVPGAPGVDSLSPDILLGRTRVVQLTQARSIDRKLLEGLELTNVTRLLLGTRNSALLRQGRFDVDYASVSEDAAQYLVDKGIKLVGIDYLSIEEYHKEGHPTHRILLEAGVVIVEGLDLTQVPPGDYELLCLPLKIKDGDGAPARVFLRDL